MRRPLAATSIRVRLIRLISTDEQLPHFPHAPAQVRHALGPLYEGPPRLRRFREVTARHRSKPPATRGVGCAVDEVWDYKDLKGFGREVLRFAKNFRL